MNPQEKPTAETFKEMWENAEGANIELSKKFVRGREMFEESRIEVIGLKNQLRTAKEALEGYKKYEEEEYGHKDSPAHIALSQITL